MWIAPPCALSSLRLPFASLFVKFEFLNSSTRPYARLASVATSIAPPLPSRARLLSNTESYMLNGPLKAPPNVALFSLNVLLCISITELHDQIAPPPKLISLESPVKTVLLMNVVLVIIQFHPPSFLIAPPPMTAVLFEKLQFLITPLLLLGSM